VAELDSGMGSQVAIDLLPVIPVVADFFAVAADGQ